ncbi:MAG: glycosyl transferase [Chloroflexi bacterium]|nr:glycosyl transferase [Chloroflexota bacterium]
MFLIALVMALLSLALFALTAFSVYLMLYTWERPERLAASKGPTTYLPPRLTFSVLVPARHEEAVIYNTVRRIMAANYPPHLVEIVVISHEDDVSTIAEAQRIARECADRRVRVETFTGGPINKPHGLNVGLQRTQNEVVTIFDAEDDVDANIFNIVNTVMLEEETGIVQAGVQLMNFRDHWFGLLNCLEYFFWFKSRLHFHAQIGMIPLGGNTVFIRRNLLERIGGWDDHCLTEDAEIGLRLSLLGEPIRVVYDAQHVTREETPPTIGAFIRQRTRWSQGFLQVLHKGSWQALPQFRQRMLAVYTLAYPILQALLFVLWPLTMVTAFWLTLPVVVVMMSFLPLYAFILQFVVTAVGAYRFAGEYRLRMPLWTPVVMAITFFPFQWVLGVSAIRAVIRHLVGTRNWEKTAHVGAHRKPEIVPASEFARLLEMAGHHLGAERGSVLLLDQGATTFSVLASRGLPPEIVASAALDATTGIAGHVARTQRPTIIDERFPNPDLKSRLLLPALRSAVVLPIQQHGSTVAVVSLSSALTTLGEEALSWLIEQVEALGPHRVVATPAR